jgi:hypothetical protein
MPRPFRVRRGHHVPFGGALTTKYRRLADGCWLWLGATNSAGYGSVRRGGHVVCAHRVVYEAFVGPVPPGKELHHTCGRRGCVNPAHAQIVDARQHNNLGRWRR